MLAIFENVATTIRQKMRAIAPRVTPSIVGEENPQTIEATLLQEIDLALNDLSKLDLGLTD